MYKIKRFSKLNLDDKLFADLSSSKKKARGQESMLVAHLLIILSTYNDDTERFYHWINEVADMTLRSSEDYTKKKYLSDSYNYKMLFPAFLGDEDTRSLSTEIVNKIKQETEDLSKEAIRDLSNIVKSKDKVLIDTLVKYSNTLNEWRKINKRMVLKSDKLELINLILKFREDNRLWL